MAESLIAAALAKILTQAGTHVFKDLAKKVGTELSIINANFERYYSSTLKNYSYTKTLVDPEHRCFLKSLYVEQTFKDSKNKSFDEYYILEKLRAGEKVIIKGHGGSGKTFFVKNAFFDLCENPMGLFPIFFELRSLNKSKKGLKKNLYELLFEDDVKLFSALAKQGKFLFILDGYDEIDFQKRGKVTDQILALTNEYPDCGILVTSRYSDDLSGWNNYLSFSVNSLQRKQTLELLGKVEYNEEVKTNFIKKIDSTFFEKHKTFLSSPLLALMMLITFGTTDQLPKKISEYYDLSFRAMFYRHDSSKRFNRARVLTFSEFQLFFSYFCMISYCAKNMVIEFDDKQLNKYIREAARLSNIEHSEQDLYREMSESTCLIQRDGLKYVFIHRSYQEYFCALGIINNITNEEKKKKLYELVAKSRVDSVIALAHEINSQDVEAYYILPCYRRFKPSFSNLKHKDIVTYSVGTESGQDDGLRFNRASLEDYDFFTFAYFIHLIYVSSSDGYRSAEFPIGAWAFVGDSKINLFGNSNLGNHFRQNYPKLETKVMENKSHTFTATLKGGGVIRFVFPQYTASFSRDDYLTKFLKSGLSEWSQYFMKQVGEVKSELIKIEKRHKVSGNSIDNLFD